MYRINLVVYENGATGRVNVLAIAKDMTAALIVKAALEKTVDSQQFVHRGDNKTVSFRNVVQIEPMFEDEVKEFIGE